MPLTNNEVDNHLATLAHELDDAKMAEIRAVARQNAIRDSIKWVQSLVSSGSNPNQEAHPGKGAEIPRVADAIEMTRPQAPIPETQEAVDERLLAAAAAMPNPSSGKPKGRIRKSLSKEEIIGLLPDIPKRFNWVELQRIAKEKGYKNVDAARIRLSLNEIAKERKWFEAVTKGAGRTPTVFRKLNL